MKKVISLILVLVMCLSLFACGNEESKSTTQEEAKTTGEEVKTTVEEVKELTLDDIKAMSILELVNLELEDVNHFSAAELKIASQTFEEKKLNTTREELEEYINEFYLKEQPELAPLAEDIMKILGVLEKRSSQDTISDENLNILMAINSNFENDYYNSYSDNVLKDVIKGVSYSALLVLYDPVASNEDDREMYSIERSDYNANKVIKNMIIDIIETPVFFAE